MHPEDLKETHTEGYNRAQKYSAVVTAGVAGGGLLYKICHDKIVSSHKELAESATKEIASLQADSIKSLSQPVQQDPYTYRQSVSYAEKIQQQQHYLDQSKEAVNPVTMGLFATSMVCLFGVKCAGVVGYAISELGRNLFRKNAEKIYAYMHKSSYPSPLPGLDKFQS